MKFPFASISASMFCIIFLGCPKGPEEETQTTQDFSLEDLNPNSPTYGQFIGPMFYRDKGSVAAFYFGDQG